MAVESDCATVLEQFIHDAANLPAEINYMLEEIQALDQQVHKYLQNIHSKESALQKQVKNHGSLVPHPKEQEFFEVGKKNYDLCLALQEKKIGHGDKASVILDRQLKKVDERIRQLQRSGQMDDDPPLPSVFDRKPENSRTPLDMPNPIALQAANLNAVGANRAIQSHTTPTIRPPQPRHMHQALTSSAQQQRSSVPATPASVVIQAQKQTEREHSAGADSKRRKLNMSTTGINLPSQPSGLRQSSMGPGTPKAGTPTGSRAGSIPRVTGPASKKAGVAVTKKVNNPAVTKLKNKHTKHVRLSQSAGRKKAGSPAVRGARAGTEVSEDSVLSSADASDTDTSQARKRRKKTAHQPEPPSASEDEGEDETDDKVYCYCSQPSYGEMVGCENPSCKREWFHISCLGLKTVPQEEHWFCPECRTEVEGQAGNKKRK